MIQYLRQGGAGARHRGQQAAVPAAQPPPPHRLHAGRGIVADDRIISDKCSYHDARQVWGCPYSGPVASYSVVQGDQFSARPRLSLEDVYDGEEAGGQLLRGRGLLADGRVAPPPSFTEQGLVSGETAE